MSARKGKLTWSDAILKVMTERGGVITLAEIYEHVPKLREATEGTDVNHILRGYLHRLVREDKIRRIGLATYALPEAEMERTIFSRVQEGEPLKNIMPKLGEDRLHSVIEGMLLELGSLYGYLTYTADRTQSFNNRLLGDIASFREVPCFASPSDVKVAENIDVIWFRKRATVPMPKLTFDVEITSDFSKALHRAYQLRDFNITLYVVAPEERREIFQRRFQREPYHQLGDRMVFRTTEDISQLYEAAIRYFDVKERVLTDPSL